MRSTSTHSPAAIALLALLLLALTLATPSPAQSQTPLSPPRQLEAAPTVQPVPRLPAPTMSVPTLVAPDQGHTFVAASRGAAPPAVTFSWNWQPGQSLLGVHSFALCLSALTAGCNDAGAFVIRGLPSSAREYRLAELPRALEGATFKWTVGACAADGTCSYAAARQLGWHVPPSPPPTLTTPANRQAVQPREIDFRWTPVAGASSYLLCVTRPTLPCPTTETDSRDVVVVRVNGATATTMRFDLRRFSDGLASWTVGACSHPAACLYQPVRHSLTVAYDGELPTLVRPANGASEDSTPTFEWTAVPWADFYLLCISATVTRCPEQEVRPGQHADLVVLRFNETRSGGTALSFSFDPSPSQAVPSSDLKSSGGSFVHRSNNDPDLYQFKGKTVVWTVAACRALYQGGPASFCRYRPETRSLRIEALWTTRIVLSELEVRDDGDNVSAGDWRVRMQGYRARLQTFPGLSQPVPVVLSVGSAEWPAGKPSQDVNTGERVTVGLMVGVRDLREEELVIVQTAAVDCDSDGLWTLANVFDGLRGVADTVVNWMQTCGGEEALEMSGSNDFMGKAGLSLGPADWLNQRNRLLRVESQGGDAGDGAFRATFSITSFRQ